MKSLHIMYIDFSSHPNPIQSKKLTMNPIILSVIFGLVSLLGYGLNDVFAKLPSERVWALMTILYKNAVLTLIIALVMLITWASWIADVNSIVLTIALSVIWYFAPLYLYKAFSVGKVSLVVPVSKSYLLIVIIVSSTVLGDAISLWKYVGIAGIISAIILISHGRDRSGDTTTRPAWMRYVFVTIISWGVFFSFIGIAARSLGWLQTGFLIEFTIFLCAGVHYLISREPKKTTKIKKAVPHIFLILCGVSWALGTLGFTYGAQYGDVAIVTTLSASTPVVSVLLSRLIYWERLTKIQYFAVLLIVASVVIISYLG